MNMLTLRCMVAVAAFAGSLGSPGRAGADYVVSVTVDDKESSFSFGRLDLTTGQFTRQFALSSFVGALTTDAGGTLYAAAAGGHLYTVGAGGVFTQFGSGTAPNPGGGLQYGYYGLAAGATGFVGVNVNQQAFFGPSLDAISADGNTVSPLTGPISAYQFNAGQALSYGPDGSLYMVATPFVNFGISSPTLYRVDPRTGATTMIGNGLGTAFQDNLALVTVGNQLYGIQASQDLTLPAHAGIYTINTTTGVATTTGVMLTGLPFGSRIDGVADALIGPTAVPEPPSMAMVLLGGLAIGGVGWARRGCRGLDPARVPQA